MDVMTVAEQFQREGYARERYRLDGVELSSVEGVQVVCTDSGSILTVYRNRDLRGLRPRSRRAHRGRAR